MAGGIVALACGSMGGGIENVIQKRCKRNDANHKMDFGTDGGMTVMFN